MPRSSARRGRCPRCNSRTIRHYVSGFPELDSFVDADGNLPTWIEFTGCVVDPGPSFDRECQDCGLRWTHGSGARVVISTWRELRGRLGVETDSEANDWLERRMLAPTSIAPFPALDDPQAKVVVRRGTAHKTLQFPFRLGEWESALIDLFQGPSRRRSDGLEQGTGASPS